MFRSATLKLTAWYAGILIILSILFSIAIYQISVHEVDTRLQRFQGLIQANSDTPPSDPNHQFRTQETNEASLSLITRLFYINLGVLVVGGAASYFLARRTLKPIEDAHEAEIRFVSNASHELRTPLAVMKSELEVNIRDKSLTTTELHEILESNLEEVNNLSTLSEILLAMAKSDHEKLEKEPIDLTVLGTKALERLRQPASRLAIVKKKSIKVMANTSSLVELMVILLDNALKYSPDTSLVKVKISEQNGRALFEVSNEGKGIEEDALDHIFDRFYRADSSRTSGNNIEKKGFGLGLSIAKQIAELHGGVITASSAPDQTTVFTLSLPKIN